ncbi:hypothetical protein EON80_30375 [bacterium]|nr:MAG: hypothetical protein EON80_30375 [bacterium]
MDTTTAFDGSTLECRHLKFERWKSEVRDPATANEEPEIVIHTNKKGAEARFSLANLPSGKCAMKYSLSYDVGSCEGQSTPWTEFETRSGAILYFTESAQKFFDREQIGGLSAPQQEPRAEMLLLLKAWRMRLLSLQQAGLPLDCQAADAIIPKSERKLIEAGQLGMVF